MKLIEIKIKNFRGYRAETSIKVDGFTVLVGRNDAGKSSILDALNIFFNESEIERDDACSHGDANDVQITCVFSDLPEDIVLDEQHPTTLEKEYLTRSDGCLEICRVYSCTGAKGKQVRIFAKAKHPITPGYNDLLGLKIKDLKTRAKDMEVDLSGVNSSIKTDLRKALWSQAKSLDFELLEVDLTLESGKTAWEQIQAKLPLYALFKSDRASTDQDQEAQDPMKAVIKETVRQHEAQLNGLIERVKSELEIVAQKTVEKIQEMSPELAKTLSPQVKNKNWDTLFSVSLTGDDGISINKRGSGTRRLVLLNFFRAKAENASANKSSGIIYAVEEPETSQHPNHQLMLLDAFQELTTEGQTQVILTTHTPTLARKARRDSLRLIKSVNGHPDIRYGDSDDTLSEIKETLGVLADHDIKVFVAVEGKWDIEFLKRASRILNASDALVPDLNKAEQLNKLVFVPLGGSSMELWANRLEGLNRPEIYITDRDTQPPDPPKYHEHIEKWNSRPGCKAFCTGKRELENYIHPDAIQAIFPSFSERIGDFSDVPTLVARHSHASSPSSRPWESLSEIELKRKKSQAKRRLNQECVDKMTNELFSMSDPDGELKSILMEIGRHLT
jgi:putative ATP-dependent endonuclease of OLD family